MRAIDLIIGSDHRGYELKEYLTKFLTPLDEDTKYNITTFMDVGAYGSVMSSNYNSRLKPAELLITKDVVKVIKRKENFEDLIALES